MDNIVIRGRLINDQDKDGILISEKASDTLQLEINDTLIIYDRTFRISGIFNSRILDSLRDLDGLPLVPQYVIMEIVSEGPPIYSFYYKRYELK